MSELYYLKTASRAAILAAILAGTLDKRRPTIEADGGRFRVGNHAPTETTVETIAVSSAGTTTLALQSHCADYIALVTASAGGGAFTRKIVIPRLATALDATTLAPQTGDTVALRVTFPASANPTIELRENTDTGTLLLSLAGTGTAFARTLHFVFNGTAWVLLDAGASSTTADDIAAVLSALAGKQPLDADLTALAALTTTGFGRALLELANAAALRTAAGLGSAATLDADTDATLAANSDAKFATQKAVKAFVIGVRDALLNSAPGQLDTLKELSDAIGADANFSATMTALIGGKAAKSANLSDLANLVTALNNLLPAQSGQSGKVLGSNGTAAGWVDAGGASFARGTLAGWTVAADAGHAAAPATNYIQCSDGNAGSITLEFVFNGVSQGVRTITLSGGSDIDLGLEGSQSSATIAAALSSAVGAIYTGIGSTLSYDRWDFSTPDSGSTQRINLSAYSGVFSAPGDNVGIDYVAPTDASGQTTSVELVPAVAGKTALLISPNIIAIAAGVATWNGQIKIKYGDGTEITSGYASGVPDGAMLIQIPAGAVNAAALLNGVADQSIIAEFTPSSSVAADMAGGTLQFAIPYACAPNA